jgi:hypothetical protein
MIKIEKSLRRKILMAKKVFVVFLASCFLVNIFSLNVLAGIAGNNKAYDGKQDLNESMGLGGLSIDQLEELISSVLKKLKEADTDSNPYAAEQIQELLGDSASGLSGEEFKYICSLYLQEMIFPEDLTDIVITPGCLGGWMFAAIGLGALTPYVGYYFLDATYTDDAGCAIAYGSWALSSLSISLYSWTNYRICAEQKSDSPDQNILNDLEYDKAFLLRWSGICLVIGSLYFADCNEELFNFQKL